MEQEIFSEAKNKMQKALEHYKHEVSFIITGRASTQILNPVKVDYYGSVVPLNTIANITSPDPQMIVIQPFDISSIDQVEKAIIKSDLGMNPNNDGKIIRLTVPPLTEERRSDLMKLVHKLIEDGKVSIRNVRREANEKLKTSEKNHEISEDDLKRSLDNIQEITNEYIDKLNELQKSKEKEILF